MAETRNERRRGGSGDADGVDRRIEWDGVGRNIVWKRDGYRSVRSIDRVTISLVVICRQIRHRDNAAKIIMGAHRDPTMGGLSEITMPTRYLL